MANHKDTRDMEADLTDIVMSLEYAYENLMQVEPMNDRVTDAIADIRFALETARVALETARTLEHELGSL